jgi:hypothetical protein
MAVNAAVQLRHLYWPHFLTHMQKYSTTSRAQHSMAFLTQRPYMASMQSGAFALCRGGCLSVTVTACCNRRLAPLMVEPQAVGGLHQIQEGDCVIAVRLASGAFSSDACSAAAISFY